MIAGWGNYVIVNPSRWGNYLIADTARGSGPGADRSGDEVQELALALTPLPEHAHCQRRLRRP